MENLSAVQSELNGTSTVVQEFSPTKNHETVLSASVNFSEDKNTSCDESIFSETSLCDQKNDEQGSPLNKNKSLLYSEVNDKCEAQESTKKKEVEVSITEIEGESLNMMSSCSEK